MKVFSVYDVKVGAFLAPFFCRAEGEAVRAFVNAVNAPDHDFMRFPEDYSLFALGEFDEESGMMKLAKAPLQICTALELVGKRGVAKVVEA